MKFTVYRTQEIREQWRLEYDVECPDHIAQVIMSGQDPNYDNLLEWAQDQPDFDIYGTPDREVPGDEIDTQDVDTGYELIDQ